MRATSESSLLMIWWFNLVNGKFSNRNKKSLSISQCVSFQNGNIFEMCTFYVIFYKLNLFSKEFGWFPRCIVYKRVLYSIQLWAAGYNNLPLRRNERSLVRSFAAKSLSSVENFINELWWCSKWKWNWISFEWVTVVYQQHGHYYWTLQRKLSAERTETVACND